MQSTKKITVPRENRTTISMPPQAWRVACALANDEAEAAFVPANPNLSRSLARIVLEWSQMTGYQPDNLPTTEAA